MLFMTLTTAPGGDRRPLAYDVKRLLQRIERELGFKGLVHYMVQTLEGNGVAHLILGWGRGPGERPSEFWIPQRWLSEMWLEIHGARVVDVRAVRQGRVGWNGRARRNGQTVMVLETVVWLPLGPGLEMVEVLV